ncbi:MAG TPA: M13 family metallopeptidase [Verrucomicrobiae bacterium]|nr:M13 family metallopeptidase [Verrucomicrobiae bacterium]
MNKPSFLLAGLILGSSGVLIGPAVGRAENPPAIPRFSLDYMNRAIEPGKDFYQFAAGAWVKNNPVPADKSRWGGFEELQERNLYLLREILVETCSDRSAPARTPRRQVGDFYASIMDTNRLEKLAFQPLQRDLERIDQVRSSRALFQLAAELHQRDVNGLFNAGVSPDARNSSIYAFELNQGGLGLPDRDYYLTDNFAQQREAYRAHIVRMFTLLGEKPAAAAAHAGVVIDLETALAKASRTRVEMRDPIKNYHKVEVAALISGYPALSWRLYLDASELRTIPYVVVGQPEFFEKLNQLIQERPLADWKIYLRWHLLRSAAPFLHAVAETAHFEFYGKTLRGQEKQEPRWQKAAKTIDGAIGEAVGRLYVEKHFPPAARARMTELIGNLRDVFRDRLASVSWMSEETRAKALAKFSRFTQKIGHPDHFRDYARVDIRRDDLWGNVTRAALFESRRQLVRVGGPVDKTEWHMTPQTVNAYFNPLQNEIVFPAGILQPPFFDLEADDPINYGAIGVVIGHEITHGYDDKGRQYDADGNLKDWWTEKDAKEFEARAQKVVDQYSSYEVRPGLHVNGKLTLGENIADLGGLTIAYEALERALTKDPAKRRSIDGFTPEQRFFLSLSQLWRTNIRDEELRRRITVDPHSPGQLRAIGAHVNAQEFFDAFAIKEGAPMWRDPSVRAKIW